MSISMGLLALKHSFSPRNQQALSTGPQIMTFQERAMTPELPSSAIQKSLQWAWGGYSQALFLPWHFIPWVWVAPHKKKELHPSSIYHPQTLIDLARGTVIQYTEGGFKIVTLWLSCLHRVSKHWQPHSSHLQHLKTVCAIGIVCPHTKAMKHLLDRKATRPEKRQSGQKSWLYRQLLNKTTTSYSVHCRFKKGSVKKASGESSTAQTQ